MVRWGWLAIARQYWVQSTRYCGAVITCLYLPFVCSDRVAAEDRFAGLDPHVREAMTKWEVPGLAIAVVKDGDVVLARGYGVCKLGEERPVTKETVFSIASCTKSFTAACVGMLVEDGKLNWDDAVRKHLPSFQVADPYVTENVTLRDLLCHRTGLVRGDLLSVKGDFSREEILRRTKLLQQAAPFRTKVTYNNVMYGVLGELIAQKSGVTYEEFVTKRILAPLELGSTFITSRNVVPEQLAARHRRYDSQVLPFQKPIRDELVAPAGAIHSNVLDMAQWLKFHLRQGEHNGQRLLKLETMQEMHALHQSVPIKPRPDANVYSPKMVGTGFGWWVRDYRGRKMVMHGGGWGAETAFVPDEDLAVVVLSNLDHNGLVWMLIADVLDAYLVGPHRAWKKEDKWDIWLKLGGPGYFERVRDEQRAELDKSRVLNTKPSQPLEKYAGKYESEIYGLLEVRQGPRGLSVQFGDHAAELSHWQDDTFFGKAVVESFLDWLVKFEVKDGSVVRLEVVSIGWKDPDERHFFRRVNK
jgi:CubicO group peptidase (beta-lactamase class C family)